MKKNTITNLVMLSILSVVMLCQDCLAESGIYVGGHIRRERPGTITKLKNSGFTYAILFNVHVEKDGSLTTDGETICKDGVYVFDKTQPDYVSDIKSLKMAPTNINRLEICIGGWGNTAYDQIKSLIASDGTGTGSILYRNFKALKEAIPELDAVNNDDEHTYDVEAATAFHVMMYDLGYKTTVAPYMRKSFWQSLVTNVNAARPGAVDRVMIQCYDGGAGNNPSDWHLDGITLHAGRLNYQDFAETKTVVKDWKENKNVKGVFFWVYNDESWNLSKYATMVNRLYDTCLKTDAPVATFYEDAGYAGYAVQLPEGRFTTSDMTRYGLADKDISSFQLSPGYKLTIYTDDHFKGVSQSYTFDSGFLGPYNDRISSLKLEKTSASFVDLTHLIVNNDFNYIAKDVPMKASTWKPKDPSVNQGYTEFYAWTCDLNSLNGMSQGINKDFANQSGEYGAWIASSGVFPEFFEFYQIIDKDALGAGTYKVQCLLSGTKLPTNQRLFANQNVQYFKDKGSYPKNQTAGEIATFAGYSNPTADKNLSEMVVYTTISDKDSLKIGIRTGCIKGDGTRGGNQWGWFKTDYFRLSKVDPVTAADASLADISLSIGELDFSPDTYTYDVVLPGEARKLTPFVTANVDDVTITGAEEVDLESGTGTSKIVVVALDGSTTKTYTINYKVPGFSLTLSTDCQLENTANTIVVTANTLLIDDNETLLVSLVDGDDNTIIEAVQARVSQGKATIHLTIPATVKRGEYFVKVAAPDGKIGGVDISAKTLAYGVYTSSFVGKNLITFGNSITAAGNSWAYQTHQNLGFADLYNGAIAGACWYKRARVAQDGSNITTQDYSDPDFAGFGNGANTTPEQFQKIINNCGVVHLQKYLIEQPEARPDYAILSYGTNDVTSAMGSVEETMSKALADVDLFTIAGALRWCIETLQTKFPQLVVYVALPIQAKDTGKNNGNIQKIEVIKGICDALSVTYFDCYNESGITVDNQANYLRDGLHPNEAGQKVHATYIMKKLDEAVAGSSSIIQEAVREECITISSSVLHPGDRLTVRSINMANPLAEVSLYDLFGKQILCSAVSGVEHTLQVPHTSGIYVLKARLADHTSKGFKVLVK